MIAAQISPYRIINQLGAGGMGEVDLTQDTKLDLKVALKVLRCEVAATQDRMRRFVREAKAAVALNQPNILTVYDIGTHDGKQLAVAHGTTAAAVVLIRDFR